MSPLLTVRKPDVFVVSDEIKYDILATKSKIGTYFSFTQCTLS